MESINSFFSDPSNLLQFTGGLIALCAAIFGIFYKDTVKKNTYKLTGWGWAVLFFLFLGALINSSSKFYDFNKERRQSEVRDSLQQIQDSIRDLQVAKLINLTQSFETLKDASFANYIATSNSFKSSLDRLTVINNGVEDALQIVNSVKFPLSYLSIQLEFSDGVDSSDFEKLAPLLLFIDANNFRKNPKYYNLNNRAFLTEINTISSNPIYDARIGLVSKFIPDHERTYYKMPNFKGFYKTRIFYDNSIFTSGNAYKTNSIKSLEDLCDMKILLILQIWDLSVIPKIDYLTFFYNKNPISLRIEHNYLVGKEMLVLESIIKKRDLDFLHNTVN